MSDDTEQSVAGAATRPCPFCAEPIKVAAIKCRWCRETLRDTSTPAPRISSSSTAPSSSALPIWYWLIPVNFARGLWWSFADPGRLVATRQHLRPGLATVFGLAVGVGYSFLTNIFATNVGYSGAGLGAAGVADYVGGFVGHAGWVAIHAVEPIIYFAIPFGLLAWGVLRVGARRRPLTSTYSVGCYATCSLLAAAIFPTNDTVFWLSFLAMIVVAIRCTRFMIATSHLVPSVESRAA